MKIRTNYVSNSSSQSFIIRKSTLITNAQEYALKHLEDFINTQGNKDVYGYIENEPLQGWTMTETDDCYEFFTIINNFSMDSFLAESGFCIEENQGD